MKIAFLFSRNAKIYFHDEKFIFAKFMTRKSNIFANWYSKHFRANVNENFIFRTFSRNFLRKSGIFAKTSWPSRPLRPVQSTCQADLSGLTCLGCPDPVFRNQRSCPLMSFPIKAVLPLLSCPTVLSWLTCPSSLIPAALPRQPCPQLSWRCCHILAVLSSLSCPGLPVQAALSGQPVISPGQLSCLSCSVLDV